MTATSTRCRLLASIPDVVTRRSVCVSAGDICTSPPTTAGPADASTVWASAEASESARRSACILRRTREPNIVRGASQIQHDLVGPPVAPAFDVFARRVAEVGRADDEDLEALRPGLVASPRAGWDTHRVPRLEL